MAKAAFITGGNGITGSAILEYLITHDKSSEWSEFIVTSRSPFKTVVQDPRIKFVALDFGKDPKALAEQMQQICANVTHAYFSSYVHKDDFQELNAANEKLFSNFLDALLSVAPNLQNCTLQTGGKHYNVHLFPVPSPAREEDPRSDSPIANFYYPQEDYLIERQRGQSWTWNVIRPEAIVGHTFKPNGMNEALTIALYMLVCKELGTEAKMPTNQRYWESTDDVSDSRLIADMTIWASTSPKTGNQAFNVTNGDYFCWKYLWPRLAAYIGATASASQTFTNAYPKEGELQLELSLDQWSKDKREVWTRLCDRHGCSEAKATWDAGTWAFQDWVFQRTWSATLSVSKARRFGWTGYIDSYESFVHAFETFVRLGQTPPLKHTSVNGAK
jgi:nucleoside-diphosphate-sugar epimerase